jgi:hypothetical protein
LQQCHGNSVWAQSPQKWKAAFTIGTHMECATADPYNHDLGGLIAFAYHRNAQRDYAVGETVSST